MTREEFEQLAHTWEEDMCVISSGHTIMSHDAFSTLLEAGMDIIPWCMEKISQSCWVGWLALADKIYHNHHGEFPFFIPEDEMGRLDLFQKKWVTWWEKQQENTMRSQAGNCSKCGAPYYVPMVWHGIHPPSPTPTCLCWNTGHTQSGTTITVNVPQVDTPQDPKFKLRDDLLDLVGDFLETPSARNKKRVLELMDQYRKEGK